MPSCIHITALTAKRCFKMNKKHSFFGSAIFYTLGVVLGLGAQFLLTTVIYGQLLGADQLGWTRLYFTWFSVFGAVVGLEAPSSINNARISYGQEQLNGYSSSLLGIGTISLVISGAVMLAMQSILVPAMSFPLPVLMAALAQGFFYFCTMLIAQKCRVSNQPLGFVVWSSAAPLLRLALCWAIVPRLSENQYLGDVFGSIIAYGATGVLAIIFLIKQGGLSFKRGYWRFCLIISAPMVFHTLSNQVLGQADTIMLEKMRGVREMGVYSFAYNIGSIANAIWLAFNNAWTVWYFDKTKEEAVQEVRELYKKYVWFVTLMTFAIILVAPDLVRLFAKDPAVAAGAGLTPVIMMGCFFMFLYTFPVNYETYRAKTIYIAIGTICAAALNIGLNFYFIPMWGGMGAAWTTLISYVMLFVFHYIISRFIIKGFQIKLGALLLPALPAAAIALLSFFAMDIVWLRWGIAAVSLVLSWFVFKRSRHIMM